jgi:hypothetical protein
MLLLLKFRTSLKNLLFRSPTRLASLPNLVMAVGESDHVANSRIDHSVTRAIDLDVMAMTVRVASTPTVLAATRETAHNAIPRTVRVVARQTVRVVMTATPLLASRVAVKVA